MLLHSSMSSEVFVDSEAFSLNRGSEHVPGQAAPLGPSPCDRCPSRRTCASGMACPDFSAFVVSGKLVDTNRSPSQAVYRQVFCESRAYAESLSVEILRLVASGYSYRRIARQFGISKDTVLETVKRDRANRVAVASG